MTHQHGFEIELSPPDLDRWAAGNCGVPFYWSFESDRPGPHVLINAITHGDELCGAIAVDRLLAAQVRPLRGTLSFGFANVEAFRRWDPARPNTGFFVDVDMNRIWDPARLESAESGRELRRAREMRALIDGVDLLLDIHSTQYECELLCEVGRIAEDVAVIPLHYLTYTWATRKGLQLERFPEYLNRNSTRGFPTARRSDSIRLESNDRRARWRRDTRWTSGRGWLGLSKTARADEKPPACSASARRRNVSMALRHSSS